jgi:hypothetical protein
MRVSGPGAAWLGFIRYVFWGDQRRPSRMGGQKGGQMDWARILAYVTCFGLLFTPAFYTFIRKLGRKEHAAGLSNVGAYSDS